MTANNSPRFPPLRDSYAYVLLAVVSLLVRLPVFQRFDLVSFDGTYYINQARTLFSGSPPSGAFPIGYPFFVAILLPFLKDAVLAARIVSLLAGVGSVIVIYLLGKNYMRKELALLCALCLSILPLFIRLSLITFSESLYVFWVLFGLLLYSGEKYLRCGFALGVAAITRPEALGILGVLALLRLRRPSSVVKIVAAFALIYSLNVATSYVWWGRLELLPKRSFLGASSVEEWQAKEYSVEKLATDGSKQRVALVGGAGSVAKNYFRRLPSETLLVGRHVAYLILVLAVWGMFRRSTFLLAALFPFLFYPLFTVRSLPRYVLPYIPIVVLYAFIGVTCIKGRWPKRLAYGVLFLSAAAAIIVNRDQLTKPVDEGHVELRSAGLQLRSQIKGARIADRKPYLPFYAEGEYVPLPNDSYEATIQYLLDNNVDYLTLHATITKTLRPGLWPLAVDRELIRGETRFVSFAAFDPTILVYRRVRDGAQLLSKPLTNPPDGFDAAPTWSPDGGKIAFASTRRGQSEIYVTATQGGDARLLVDMPGEQSYPAWSPDGHKIAFSTKRDGRSQIHTIDIVSGDTEFIVENAAAPSWSSDGREIIYHGFENGKSDIWSKNLSSGIATRISNVGDDAFPAISPQGDRIAWIRKGRYVVIYNRQVAQEILAKAPRVVGFRPTWSPDGKYIAVTGNDWGSTDVYLMTADGTSALLLSKHGGIDAQPCWSPDGERMAIMSDRGERQSIWILTGLEPFTTRLSSTMRIRTLR